MAAQFAPLINPNFNALMPAEVLALMPVADNSLQTAFANYQPVSDMFMETVAISATNKLIFTAVDNLYGPRLWVGPKEAQQLVVRSMDVVPVPYEITWAVDQFLWEDAGPQIGNVLTGVFANVGNQTAEFKDVLAGDALAAANSTVGYDGAYICSQTHPVDPENVVAGTWSNDLSDLPLTTENIAYAIAQFKLIPKKNGTPWSNRRKGVILVLPPALEFAGRQAIQSSIIARAVSEPSLGVAGVGPEDNTYLSSIVDDVVVLQTLTDPDAWFLFDRDEAAHSSLVLGLRTPWYITPMIAPTDPAVFDQHLFQWSAVSRQTVAFLLPQNLLRASSGGA